ncbi:MAG: hypothetical protein ACO1SV_25345 [Fimbriimonas sp.]
MLLLTAIAVLAPATVVALGVNETPRVNFGSAWTEAKRLGIRAVTLPVDWAAAERKPGDYEVTLPKIADGFYPGEGVEIGLVLRDLNTNRDERPADLRPKPFDDPASLDRWKMFADAVLDAMPKSRLSWISVGNEVDASLGSDPAKIAAYARHLRNAFAHLRKRRPGIRLGTALTFDGVRERGPILRPILAEGDVAMVNYYLMDGARRPPRTQVPKDLDAMAAFAGSKPLLVTEAGAPSGTVIGSSEAAQAEFIETLLPEVRRRKIPYVNLVWMNDVGDAEVAKFTGYYGSAAPEFKDFLGTLGLRRADGKPKPAWTALTKFVK